LHISQLSRLILNPLVARPQLLLHLLVARPHLLVARPQLLLHLLVARPHLILYPSRLILYLLVARPQLLLHLSHLVLRLPLHLSHLILRLLLHLSQLHLSHLIVEGTTAEGWGRPGDDVDPWILNVRDLTPIIIPIIRLHCCNQHHRREHCKQEAAHYFEHFAPPSWTDCLQKVLAFLDYTIKGKGNPGGDYSQEG
jgi:hypothetical protein